MLLDATCWNHTIYFLLGVNICCVFTLKKPLAKIFFQSLLSGRKRHLIRVWIYGTLFGICHILSNAHHIIFQFSLNSQYQRNIFVMVAALVSLSCYWRCLLNVQLMFNQQARTKHWFAQYDDTKQDIDKYIKNGFYTKIFSLIWLFLEFLEIKKTYNVTVNEFIWAKLQAFHILLFWRRNSFAGFCFCFWPPV